MRKVAPPRRLSATDVERALARLEAYVRAKGLKGSAVREGIARAALALPGHFTTDDLVRALREGGGAEAHAATVYRVLPLLEEAGLIHKTMVSAADGHRWERAFERDHHDHIVCTACGKVVEFEFEAIELLQQELAQRLGFRLTGHVHELFGLCRRCDAAS